MSKETIETRSGLQLTVETRGADEAVEVSVKAPVGKRCLLHWGVRHDAEEQWLLPPQSVAGRQLFRRPGRRPNPFRQTERRSRGRHPSQSGLHVPRFRPFLSRRRSLGQQRWPQLSHRLGSLRRWQALASVLDVLHTQIKEGENVFERTFDIEGQWQVAAVVTKSDAGGATPREPIPHFFAQQCAGHSGASLGHRPPITE